MRAWPDGAVRPLALTELGERYRRYRLPCGRSEEAMAGSLRQYGQLSPVVVCVRQGQAELRDGFKRRAAAALVSWSTLSARVVEVDEAQAKAALYGLNRTGSRPQQLEEAWIVYALVREDGLTQVQAAERLGQHKSWVCRRLALLERLGDEAKAKLRLGLLAPSLARQWTRLPVGNQAALLGTVRREALTAVETRGVIDLLRGARPAQAEFILGRPREALLQAEGVPGAGEVRAVRLSPSGNRVARQLRCWTGALHSLANWLRYPGLAELTDSDRQQLLPRLQRLSQDRQLVAGLVADVLDERLVDERRTTSAGRAATQRDRAALAGADVAAADSPRTGCGPDDGAARACAGGAAAGGRSGGVGAAPAGAAAEFAVGARRLHHATAGALPEHDRRAGA